MTLKFQTSNGHCIFHRTWKNYCKAIFSKISALQSSGCAFETVLVASFHLTPITTKSDNKKFLVWKSKPIPLTYLQYSKFKKFCVIKNVNMQIDKNRAAAVLLRLYWSPPFIWHQFQPNRTKKKKNFFQKIFHFQFWKTFPN